MEQVRFVLRIRNKRNLDPSKHKRSLGIGAGIYCKHYVRAPKKDEKLCKRKRDVKTGETREYSCIHRLDPFHNILFDFFNCAYYAGVFFKPYKLDGRKL